MVSVKVHLKSGKQFMISNFVGIFDIYEKDIGNSIPVNSISIRFKGEAEEAVVPSDQIEYFLITESK
ncbi:hypothetical protein [Proteiniclasticum ruminis]|uniref:Uncharacterized protein n=1 Tax=Proteiniclasticum ruminis TaxID=398199 RepID=A0A1I4ZJD2_9CLOT|nr:hypothetical protein [Proteiniclasticum ruminis]SFN50354.1 hypothetical protein SAMN04488695_10216 [Proteiniclasticum ruminis]